MRKFAAGKKLTTGNRMTSFINQVLLHKSSLSAILGVNGK